MHQEGRHPTSAWWSTLQSQNSRCRLFALLCPDSKQSSTPGYIPGRRGQAHIGEAAVSVYVFTGPTISPAEASRELEAVYLPPAAEGDVYRVTLKRPQAIGIIDGYFQSIPDGTPQRDPMGDESRNPCIRQRQHRSPSCGGTGCIWDGGRRKFSNSIAMECWRMTMKLR